MGSDKLGSPRPASGPVPAAVVAAAAGAEDAAAAGTVDDDAAAGAGADFVVVVVTAANRLATGMDAAGVGIRFRVDTDAGSVEKTWPRLNATRAWLINDCACA